MGESFPIWTNDTALSLIPGTSNQDIKEMRFIMTMCKWENIWKNYAKCCFHDTVKCKLLVICYLCYTTLHLFNSDTFIVLTEECQISTSSHSLTFTHLIYNKTRCENMNEEYFSNLKARHHVSWTRETHHFKPALIKAFNKTPLISIPKGRKVISAVMPHVLGVNFLESHHKRSD